MTLRPYILALTLLCGVAACETPAPRKTPPPVKAVKAPKPAKTARPPAELFAELIQTKDLSARRLAWQLATRSPSPEMADAMRFELSRLTLRSRGANVGLSPEAALAVRANRLKEAYPLLRTSLMAEGHLAYAQAMIELDGAKASSDLLSYLALATPDEILEGQLKKVHRATAELALARFAVEPPPESHPGFVYLSYYAASKDDGLSKPAAALLAQLSPLAPPAGH